tara:strand:- start:412 stop:1209 length:798 start_codon:yes stop_codon:yes gene_type:complete
MNIPKIIFIVPYRNREYIKNLFSVYMKYILEDYNENDYEIYYSFQNDKKPFNRGAIKNIGFIAIKDKYPDHYKNITLVFNDIDTIPYIKNTLNYSTVSGRIKHFYGFKFALGGIFSITGSDFETCEGFPNFYSWGYEDNTINDRVIKNFKTIDRSEFFSMGSKEILQINNSDYRLVDNDIYKIYSNKETLNKNTMHTIKNINYKINKENNQKNEFIIDITNFDTNINPFNKTYYNKHNADKMEMDLIGKLETRKKWSLNNFYSNK